MVGVAKDLLFLHIVDLSSDIFHYCLVALHAIWECPSLSGLGPGAHRRVPFFFIQKKKKNKNIKAVASYIAQDYSHHGLLIPPFLSNKL